MGLRSSKRKRRNTLRAAVALLLAAHYTTAAAAPPPPPPPQPDVSAQWHFDDGLDGWAAATSNEMQAEVQPGGGQLRGLITGPAPYVDSPTFAVNATDSSWRWSQSQQQLRGSKRWRVRSAQRQAPPPPPPRAADSTRSSGKDAAVPRAPSSATNCRDQVVLRMLTTGRAARARLELLAGFSAARGSARESDWERRPAARVYDASAPADVGHVLDGNLKTGWDSGVVAPDGAWLSIDLGAAYPVDAIDIWAGGTIQDPARMRLLWALEGDEGDDGDWRSAAEFFPAMTDAAQHFDVPTQTARYWRLEVLATHGAQSALLREVKLSGPPPQDSMAHAIDFAIIGDGAFHTYYIPVSETFSGLVTQLRVRPGIEGAAVPGGAPASPAPQLSDTFIIDWVRVARSPHVYRVRGCVDRYFPGTAAAANFTSPSAPLSTDDWLINDSLAVGATHFGIDNAALPYATTYNCPRGGGYELSITGTNFGAAGAVVTVGGRACAGVRHAAPQTQLTCTLPPAADAALLLSNGTVAVRVTSGLLPGLWDEVPYLSYATAPPVLPVPALSNLAARSVDVSWTAPNNTWQAVTVTGYQIAHTLTLNASLSNSSTAAVEQWITTVGNVTTTTITDLQPNTTYAFWVRALTEDASNPQWRELDLYGRRTPLPDALRGPYSPPAAAATLAYDVDIADFSAFAAVDAGAADARASAGPRGAYGGEGHYGLRLVGSAQIQNCNATSACCDGHTAGAAAACATAAYTCSGALYPSVASALAANGSLISKPRPGIKIAPFANFTAAGMAAAAVSGACGPALTLTGPHANQAGAVWYPRAQTVGEGFESNFTFRISNPSLR
ncbi:hypothetical protein JKP88DRAFT_299373 [Tribonema minus]|uniref:Uncharacterized protein n=1 Tax=Tribonema minus TaxID=303371 RepID=A0A835ZJQ0_9STRA|nr:hypothetical protein JKP88DRAFT_299373 [Tribonema minus]